MRMNDFKRWNKNRINYLYFSYSDFFDYDNFVTELKQNLQESVQYSLLLKIQFNKDKYIMSGSQLGFVYKQDSDIDYFENVHNIFLKRISKLGEDYYVEVINSIQLLYVRIEDMPLLKIKNLNKVNFKKFIDESGSKSRFKTIPLTINEKYFGKLLLKDRDIYLDRINNQRSLLNESNLLLDEISSMYLYKEYVIINSEKNGIIYRDIYDSTSGYLHSKIKDVIVKDNLFIRTIGNNSLTVLNDTIVKIESNRHLSVIRHNPKPLKDEPNTLIGS